MIATFRSPPRVLPSTTSDEGEGSLFTLKELGDDALQQGIMRDLGECLSRLGKFWEEPEPAPVEIEAEAGIEAGRFDRYELLEMVGQGGFGLVFRAYDPVLSRVVAIKVPRPEAMMTPHLKGRFLREARAAAALDHPNIVPVYDTGQIGPLCFIASAFYEGTTLAAWLKENPAPGSHQAARLIQTLASALVHAHERGILHRDLKPSNILLQGDRPAIDLDAFIPRISDFGLAKIAEDDSDITHTDVRMGSPPSMSPEQALGHLDRVGAHSDVYALGATLYHMLFGRPPFLGQSRTDLLHRIVEADPIAPRLLRHDLPRDLETICLKCLQKDPRRRYPFAGLLAEDLGRFLRGEPILARPASIGELGLKWARRRPLRSALILVAGLALAGTFGAIACRDALIQLHDAELDREILRANRHAQDAETQSRLASSHADSASIREAYRAMADLKPEPAQEILQGIGPESDGTVRRGFAWRHLWRQANRDVSMFWGHETRVIGIQLAPDGKTLASQDLRGNVFLWDMDSRPIPRRPRMKLPNDFHRTCELSFSAESRFVACLFSSIDNRHRVEIGVRWYQVAGGRPAHDLDAPQVPEMASPSSKEIRGEEEPADRLAGQEEVRPPFLWSIPASSLLFVNSPAGKMPAIFEDGRIVPRDLKSGHILQG